MKGTYLELAKPELYSGRYAMMKGIADDARDETPERKSPSKRLTRKYTSLDRIRKKVDQQNSLIQFGTKKERRTLKKNDESMLPPISTISTNVDDLFDVNGPSINYRTKDVTTPYIGMRSNTGAVSPVSKNQHTFRAARENGYSMHKRDMDNSYENIPNVVNLSPVGRKIDRTKERKHNSNKHSNVLMMTGETPRIRMTNRTEGKSVQTPKILPKDNLGRPSPIHKSEGTFSIRKKIEQFRQWHEEQYKDKIKKLKQEIDTQYEIEKEKKTRKLKSESSPDLSVFQSEKTSKSPRLKRTKENRPPNTRTRERKFRVEVESSSDSDSGERVNSAKTWKTWRDMNDSYAYKNVKKYIEDNELMTTEKEEWIEKWIIDVDEAVYDVHPGKSDVENKIIIQSDEESLL